MDGFAVASLEEAAASGGMLISATGERATIPLSALEAAPEGAIVTVAGGVDGEVSIDEAVAASWVMAESGDPHVQTLTSPSGKTLRVLERGEGINYTAGEGNPIEIMDMSFGVQLASLREPHPRRRAIPRPARPAARGRRRGGSGGAGRPVPVIIAAHVHRRAGAPTPLLHC